MERRSFFKILAGAGVAFTGCRFSRDPIPQTVTAIAPSGDFSLSGTIVAGGTMQPLLSDGALDPEYDFMAGRSGGGASSVTLIDLKSGAAKSARVPVSATHTVIDLPEQLVCLGQQYFHKDPSAIGLIDRDLRHPRRIELDPKWRLTGHGHYDAQNGYLAVGVVEAADLERPGSLLVYDPKTMKLRDLIALEAPGPHDMVVTPDGKELAVCNYGAMKRSKDRLESFNGKGAGISFLDRKTLKTRTNSPSPISEPVSHIAFAKDGSHYTIYLQGYLLSSDGAKKLFEKEKFDLSPLDFSDQMLAKPLAVVRVDQSGRSKSYFHGGASQRRAQSIEIHPDTQAVVATFTFSDTIVLVDPASGSSKSIRSRELGISRVRGVCSIVGTPYFAVSGQDRGLAIVDSKSGKLVTVFDHALSGNVHLRHLV